jgi:hypothetical protein
VPDGSPAVACLEAVRLKNRIRIAAGLLVATVALSSNPAWAVDDVAGETIQSCGKWVLKLVDFGKLKIRNYNGYVPDNFQTTEGRLKPSVFFVFGPAGTDTFNMAFIYPDQQGMNVFRSVTGSYTHKGKKLKFKLDADGVAALEETFADLGENKLFGKRALVTDIPFVNLKESSVKFKGRIKNSGRFKAKLKTRLKYDIQYVTNSEFADRFDAKGVFKLRSKSKDCDD